MSHVRSLLLGVLIGGAVGSMCMRIQYTHIRESALELMEQDKRLKEAAENLQRADAGLKQNCQRLMDADERLKLSCLGAR